MIYNVLVYCKILIEKSDTCRKFCIFCVYNTITPLDLLRYYFKLRVYNALSTIFRGDITRYTILYILYILSIFVSMIHVLLWIILEMNIIESYINVIYKEFY